MTVLRSRKRGHNAGFLAYDVVITYPFHPMAGQVVPVVGEHDFDGVRYLLIRQTHGGTYHIPD